VPYAVSAATSLALALELTLKVVHFQNFGKYPRTHDVLAIVRGLPEETRMSMDKFYKEMYARQEPPDVVHFSVGLDMQGSPRTPHQVPDVSSLQLAVEHVRDAFVIWRYVYERLETPKPVDIHFKALLCLIEAAKNEVAQFRGNSQVIMGSGSSVV
jgi:hypothetical protein